jgi:hypothetical protein
MFRQQTPTACYTDTNLYSTTNVLRYSIVPDPNIGYANRDYRYITQPHL